MLPLALTRRLALGVGLAVLAGPPASALAHEVAHHRAEHQRHGHGHEATADQDELRRLEVGPCHETESHAHLGIDHGLSVKFDPWFPALTSAGQALVQDPDAESLLQNRNNEPFFLPPAHPPPCQPRAPPRS